MGPGIPGGIVLEQVDHSTLRKNKANRVWDACSLVHSDENTVEENDFSHASNTCMRLWTACRNRVSKNELSWGLRIKKGEVHARDSACLLVESGSNNNRFLENDIRHGGDGVFIRALNGWVSSGNVFEGNDASYAHNNCFEAQSPRNTYRRNRANHGSHGFWLGISDQTVLEDNEACFNGDPDGHHNAPWPFNYAPYDAESRARRHHLRRSGKPHDRAPQQVHRQPRCRHRLVRRFVAQAPVQGLPLGPRTEHLPRQPLGNLPGVRRLDRHGGQRL